MPPPDFTDVAKVSDVSPGEMKVVMVDRERYILVNLAGDFFSIRDECGHAFGLLSKGWLEDDLVVCPRHYARYDLRTGALVDGPLAKDVPACQVLVEDDTIYLKPPDD